MRGGLLPLLMLFLVSRGEAWTGELVLAADGRSAYQVVVPETAPHPEIAEWLSRSAELIRQAFAANGFTIVVVSEQQAAPGIPAIYLGDTAFARKHGLAIDVLSGWSYLQRVVGQDVVLAGHDVAAVVEPDADTSVTRRSTFHRVPTVKAVTDFLRVYAGTRFLWPGETGIEFLPVTSIRLPEDLDVKTTPGIMYNSGSRFQPDFFYFANNYFPMTAVKGAGHSYPRAVPAETYGESHPEYFALLGGKREPGDHLCISNPQVQELIYQDLVRWIEMGYEYVSLGQQDGFRGCTCEACVSLFGVEEWGEKLWIFHRQLAERLLKEHPQAKVVILAYTVTEQHLPETFSSFPANAIIQLCDTNPASFARWRPYDVPAGFTTYLYNWGNYHPNPYSPKRTPEYVATQIKRLHANNTQGIYLDGYGEAPGLEAPTYYVFGRMLDDPEHLTADVLVNEFYEAAFGNATQPMQAFYGELFHAIAPYSDLVGIRNEYWSYKPANARRSRQYVTAEPMRLLSFLYSGELVSLLQGKLAEAEALATEEKVKRRLSLIRLETDRLQKMALVLHRYQVYALQKDVASRELLLDAIDAWNAWLTASEGKWGGLPGWPEMKPFKGHGSYHVGLKYSAYKANFSTSPFAWDVKGYRALKELPKNLDEGVDDALEGLLGD